MTGQFQPAPVIHNAAEMLVCAAFDVLEDVYRPRERHVTDKAHGDDDPQIRQHAPEDDLHARAVHDGASVIDHVHPRGLMRGDICGDFRACVSYTVALTVQTHDLAEVRLGFLEIENFCSFHGEILLYWGNFANPSIYRSIGDMFGDTSPHGFENLTEGIVCPMQGGQ